MTFYLDLKARLLAGLLIALTSTFAMCADASARNLYISPNGDGSDGTTWKKAWKNFQSVQWNTLLLGDVIHVDGGATSTTYTGDFSIPVSGITIRQAGAVGRNGQVIITRPSGSPPAPPVTTGVNITGSNVHIIATRRSGIKIFGFGAENVRIQSNYNSLRNVELGGVTGFMPYAQGRIGALIFGGYNNQFINCDFRESTSCAYERPLPGANNHAVFRNCTFGNDGYGFWGVWGVGIFGARVPSDGSTVISTIQANKCVFGPMLNKGVDAVQGRVQITDSLFLGSNVANVHFRPVDGSTAQLIVNNCTLYEPNYSGFAQYDMGMRNIYTSGFGTMKLKNSIVYGGQVVVPATQNINAGGNFQFHVTGNTTAVAAAMVDPQMVQESALWAPITPTTISPRVWTTNNYARSSTSPALGKGSSITSVTSIVPAYGPAGRLPPLGGP